MFEILVIILFIIVIFVLSKSNGQSETDAPKTDSPETNAPESTSEPKTNVSTTFEPDTTKSCKGVWQDVSVNNCDASCGETKTKEQKFIVIKEGDSCPDFGRTRIVDCNLPKCPQNIQGIEKWIPERGCSEPCGGGKKREIYTITNLTPQNESRIVGLKEGTIQDHLNGRYRERPCNTEACESCEAGWSDVSKLCYLNGTKHSSMIKDCGPNAFKIKTWEV